MPIVDTVRASLSIHTDANGIVHIVAVKSGNLSHYISASIKAGRSGSLTVFKGLESSDRDELIRIPSYIDPILVADQDKISILEKMIQKNLTYNDTSVQIISMSYSDMYTSELTMLFFSKIIAIMLNHAYSSELIDSNILNSMVATFDKVPS